ncbi:MAG: hypothetical protein ABI612_15550 [Betaproteobacteria bacterium]
MFISLRPEQGIPGRSRAGVFDVQGAQIELPLSNASHLLNARYGDHRVAEHF